jgi:hypothetical protein
MSSSIQFTEEELIELYGFMEKANELFHQPMNYSNSELISKFADDNYPLFRKYYYDVLWDKLPKELQEKIQSE